MKKFCKTNALRWDETLKAYGLKINLKICDNICGQEQLSTKIEFNKEQAESFIYQRVWIIKIILFVFVFVNDLIFLVIYYLYCEGWLK